MISSVLALMLLAAPTPAEVSRARIDYNRCLGDHMTKSLKGDTTVDAFGAEARAACAAKEQAFRSLVIAVDTAAGFKRAEADDNATFEIDDMLANTVETFRSYRGSGKQPVQQAAAEEAAPAPAEAATVTPASAPSPK